MNKELGISDANRLLNINDGIIQNWDNYTLPPLVQNGFLEPIAYTLGVPISPRLSNPGKLVKSLLHGTGRDDYSLEEITSFIEDLDVFITLWAQHKSDGVAYLKKYHNEYYPNGSVLSQNIQQFSYRLSHGINQHILAILSIRAKQWAVYKKESQVPVVISNQKHDLSENIQHDRPRSPLLIVKKFLAHAILSTMDRSIQGRLDPNLKKSVIIVAPHNTGLQDVAVGWAVRTDQSLQHNRFMAKKEAYDHPLYGWLLQRLGAIRIDREQRNGVTSMIKDEFASTDALNLVITPEGTRKANVQWKTSFYYIATGADVPLIMIGFDYAARKVVISDPIKLTGNPVIDQEYIKKWYADNISGFQCNLILSK